MRLTLRTMLAYMDDILEPEDAADIGKKLEESDLAKTIMQRLRESIRRVRLGAPPALGHGMGLDPNSVAEYLDNTLPAEQVGEFEKICLESDMHLAEVGACHQILTLVLGEPAEVDATARERMYHLTAPARPAEPAAAPAPAPAPAALAAVARPVVAQPARRVKPEVPDYMRRSPSRNWGAIAAVIALVIVCGGVAAAILRPELLRVLAKRDQDAAGQPPADEQAQTADRRVGKLVVDAPTDEKYDTTDETEAAGQPPLAGADEGAAGAENPAGEAAEGEAAMPDENMQPDELPPAEGGAAAAATVVPGAPVPLPAAGGAAALPVTAPPAAAAPAEEPATGEVMGRYVAKQDVLLRLDPQTRLWRRMSATPSLSAGDQLMSLPTFRSTINLMSGLTLEPVDAARFTLLGTDEAGMPTIGLDFGRFVFFTAGKPQNSVRLRIGDYQPQVTFVDGESTMAVQLQRIWVPGRNPTQAAGPLVADLYVTSGSVTWTAGGAPATWQAPLHARLDADGVKLVDHETAKWTAGQTLTKVERDAADVVEHELAADRPTTLSVKELLGDRRSEVRTLGMRIAANVDEFLPLVKMLHDPDQRHLWQTEIEVLRATMVRDPETAELIQAAFTNFHPADGDELFHLLWGYSGEELADGGMNKLVDYLNHDSLEFRVLAFSNLYEISGKKTLGYRPEAPAATRQKLANDWKKRIKEIKIPGGS